MWNTATIKSINKLQALVWGGAVESFQFSPRKPTAFIRFMTAQGCNKYFDSTENGVDVPGEKTVVLVDRQDIPNSSNDLLQRLVDGKVTRCVRAEGADADWEDAKLLALVRGYVKNVELDRIVRGTVPGTGSQAVCMAHEFCNANANQVNNSPPATILNFDSRMSIRL